MVINIVKIIVIVFFLIILIKTNHYVKLAAIIISRGQLTVNSLKLLIAGSLFLSGSIF